MQLILRVLIVVVGLASLGACSGYGHMDPIKTGGDAAGDIKN